MLVQTIFLTGLHIVLLAHPGIHDPQRHRLLQEDVSFTAKQEGAWTLFLTIRLFKGYNPATNMMEVCVCMHPLHKAHNILLEPGIVHLILLMQRGALWAYGPQGPWISSVEELLASQLHCFVGVGKEAMFCHILGGPMSTITACGQLKLHTDAVRLPYGSFHWLRKDFAMEMQMLFGSAVCRELMHHNMHNDALNHAREVQQKKDKPGCG